MPRDKDKGKIRPAGNPPGGQNPQFMPGQSSDIPDYLRDRPGQSPGTPGMGGDVSGQPDQEMLEDK